MKASPSPSRRQFLRTLSLGVGASAFALPALSALQLAACGQDPTKNQEHMPHPSDQVKEALQTGRKLGIALVGLGGYSRGQLAPALQETKLCRLAGIVTGSPDKIPEWKSRYNIPDKNVYSYKTFDRIADNPDIDIIYIVLPNGLHAEYTIRAAEAGKHVICEKPMATSVEDCKAMISACNKAGKKLSIGYRLHFEPHNLEMMRLGQHEVFGPVDGLTAEDGFPVSNPHVWRLDQALAGGGPLMDVGIYCVQGGIYTKGQVPISVTAQYHPVTKKELFDEVEQGLDWQMQFEDGSVAHCKTSYAQSLNKLRAEAKQGWFELEPAYSYGGIRGRTSKGPMNLPNVNQQARQMDDFASCILTDTPTRVPGEMGMRDVAMLYSIYEAANSGKKIPISQEARAVGVDRVANHK